MKIIVIGGTGLIGTKVVKNLRDKGHEVVAASPSKGINSVTGEGLAKALVGAQVVVDVANAPSWEDKDAAGVAEAALAEPLNGTVDLAGPEPIRQDDLVRQFLNATGDARTVITDPKALYFGIAVNDQSLTPGDHPRLGPTRFADWLSRNA